MCHATCNATCHATWQFGGFFLNSLKTYCLTYCTIFILKAFLQPEWPAKKLKKEDIYQPKPDHSLLFLNLFSSLLDVPLPPHGDECQAAEGQCGDGLQQVGHQPGWGSHQGGVC